VRIHGELPRLEEMVLVICNHKCDLDYCYLWSALARAPAYGYWRVGLFKAVIKAQIKLVPVFAWGIKSCGFLYLSRSWDTDRARMKRWALAMARDKVCALESSPSPTRPPHAHFPQHSEVGFGCDVGRRRRRTDADAPAS